MTDREKREEAMTTEDKAFFRSWRLCRRTPGPDGDRWLDALPGENVGVLGADRNSGNLPLLLPDDHGGDGAGEPPDAAG